MIIDDKKLLDSPIHSMNRAVPPLSRHAMHVFYKTSEIKDAKYVGMWNCGKMHGK